MKKFGKSGKFGLAEGLLTVLLIAVASACGGGGKDKDSGGKPKNSAKIVIGGTGSTAPTGTTPNALEVPTGYSPTPSGSPTP
jgi:hypothetical protein